ncbi:MAG: hypothetical protein V1787_06720 [Candidatus Micrarchaeota archaeon]
MELSFEALRKVQLQERNFGALSALQDDFYESYSLWILEQQRALKSGFTIERMKVFENSKKILDEVRLKREQKILLKALKDYRNGAVSSDGLAKEEKALYVGIVGGLKEFEETAASPAGREKPEAQPIAVDLQTAAEEKPEPPADSLKLKFAVAVPQFVGLDGTSYGPYEAGKVASVKKEVAEILVRKGAAGEYDERTESKKAIDDAVEQIDTDGIGRETKA